MLQEKLNSVIKLQVTLAILAAGISLSVGESNIAFSIAYVSAIMVVGGMSLGAGIIQASEITDSLKGMQGLYIRAFIRFGASMGLLIVGFMYLSLNMRGIIISLLLYYVVPLFELAKEAMGLNKREELKSKRI